MNFGHQSVSARTSRPDSRRSASSSSGSSVMPRPARAASTCGGAVLKMRCPSTCTFTCRPRRAKLHTDSPLGLGILWLMPLCAVRFLGALGTGCRGRREWAGTLYPCVRWAATRRIVVRERYVPRIRHSEAQLAAAAPLLCAGITTYSPLRHWNVGPGHKVGVVGTGGLGHMGIKLARAMGAHEVAISRHADEMAARVRSLDCILNIVAAPHDLDPYFALLKRDGAMAAGRRARHAASVAPGVQPIMKRRSLAGSMIGGIPETQVKYRFVIDIASRGARRAQACGQLPRSSNVQAVARFFDLGWLTVQTLDKASQPWCVSRTRPGRVLGLWIRPRILLPGNPCRIPR